MRDSDVDHTNPALREHGLREFKDTKKIAVFHVARVWKGDVGATFEMPAVEETSACVGFWPNLLHVGADLIVYARKQGSDYYTYVCGENKAAKDSNGKEAKDLAELGRGREPSTSQPSHSQWPATGSLHSLTL